MKYKFWRLSIFVQVLFLLCILGCKVQDNLEKKVSKVAGKYSVRETNPAGKTEKGQATITNAGDLVSVVIDSDAGSFAITGRLLGNEIQSTFTDSLGAAATASIVFANDLNSFIGNIQTTTGGYVINGSRQP